VTTRYLPTMSLFLCVVQFAQVIRERRLAQIAPPYFTCAALRGLTLPRNVAAYAFAAPESVSGNQCE
jgi:hypothetical protein